MITSLHIKGFRGFAELNIEGLTRVNLLVGANNSGKTSILEAVELLAIGRPRALFRSPMRRGEELFSSVDEPTSELDVSHLWFGHRQALGSSISITSKGHPQKFLECEIVAVDPKDEGEVVEPRPQALEMESAALGVRVRSDVIPRADLVRLSPNGGIPLQLHGRLLLAGPPEKADQVTFLGTEMLQPGRLGQLWDSVVLTPEETSVTEALRIIEPNIERLAFLGESRRYGKSGIFVKMSNSDNRIPLGSIGDGLKRLLALSLHLIPAGRGILLVDEIDTGLHFTVMENMWRLVIEIARRLDVQVFATTHSLDCVRSLARVRERLTKSPDDVSLHRVEAGLGHTIAFSMEELVIAARDHIEVR